MTYACRELIHRDEVLITLPARSVDRHAIVANGCKNAKNTMDAPAQTLDRHASNGAKRALSPKSDIK